jgi:hypothetical protein
LGGPVGGAGSEVRFFIFILFTSIEAPKGKLSRQRDRKTKGQRGRVAIRIRNKNNINNLAEEPKQGNENQKTTKKQRQKTKKNKKARKQEARAPTSKLLQPPTHRPLPGGARHRM